MAATPCVPRASATASTKSYNAGSSSLKFTVFSYSDSDFEHLEMLAKGQVECIGLPTPHLVYVSKTVVKTKAFFVKEMSVKILK